MCRRIAKLKIAQVCPYDINRPGGVQRHILDLSAALRKLGHEITVLAPRVTRGRGLDLSQNHDGRTIIFVGSGRLMSINKTVCEITLAVGKQLNLLDESLQTGAFDLVHVHNPLSPFLPIQAMRKSRVANVATFHAVPPEIKTGSAQRFLYRQVSKRLMPQLDGVILASNVQRDLHEIDASPTSPITLPPCTNLRRFAISRLPFDRYRDQRINILFLGRLERRKGAMTLLRAYDALCRQGIPIRLIVAGDGPERKMLEQFVFRRGVPEVVFLGTVDDVEVPRWYATCDIFCAPSLYAEGFGIVVVEAMASGRPIVAAANAGYKTLFSGEAACFLSLPGDDEMLCTKLKALIANEKLRNRLGEWGRLEAQRYDSDALAPKFIAAYEKAIQQFQFTKRNMRGQRLLPCAGQQILR
jgi:phosphatidylinositol alpha-mannosyltransferase